MDYLIQIYESVLETSVQQVPFLIYQESSMMARLAEIIVMSVSELHIDGKVH